MTSQAHQWLVLWIARRMTADGLRVVAYDGPTPQGGSWNLLPLPSAFPGGYRPDVLAVDSSGAIAGIGEAKSAIDVWNRHTSAQLRAYSVAVSAACKLYVGVPHSALFQLDRALASLGVKPAHAVRVHVPDVLLAA